MKDKVNQFMEKCKQNKKKAALGVVLLFLLLVALGAGAYSLNNENEPVQKVAKTESQTKEEKKVPEDLKKTETEETDEKESKVTASETEKKKEEKEASEEKKEDAQKSTDTQAAKAEVEKATEASKPASQPVASTPVASEPVVSNPVVSEPVTSKPTHTHDYQPVHTQKWVVDQAAWTETVETPVYTTVERCICNGCGADITDNLWTHLKESALAGGSCGGYHSGVQQIQTGTNKEIIEHPEQGHNEDVIAYYQCSCGATK